MTASEAMALIAERDLVGWHGLPSCSLADVTGTFGRVGEGVGSGRIGTDRRDFVLVYASGYEEPLRVWLGDSDEVLALDVEYPALPDLPAQLGEPEERRDFHWAGLELANGELVYPSGSLERYDERSRLELPPHRRRPLRRQ